jgi:nucleoside 2-deoxyribosyltransferase
MARTGKKHDMTAYLAGAIEATDDEGRTWRERYRRELATIGVEAWIPNDLNLEHELTMEQWIVLRSKDDLTEFKTEFRKRIIGPDIAAVDAADVIIVRWNGERTTGTAHEVGRAYMRGQMVYLVTPPAFPRGSCLDARMRGGRIP